MAAWDRRCDPGERDTNGRLITTTRKRLMNGQTPISQLTSKVQRQQAKKGGDMEPNHGQNSSDARGNGHEIRKLAAKHSEIWRLATTMEDHKSEIEDWDLGAGIFISFYVLRSSLQEDSNTMTELGTLENKNVDCRDFIVRLNKCLAVLGSKVSLDARVVYSKMAEEISSLLLSDIDEGSSGEVQLSCFNTVFTAPIPEDLGSYHLREVVSLFTSCLSEMAH